jgi:hypothetical protein
MGWRGVKDSDLLTLAEAYPFDGFITADKNLPYQQNLRGLALRIVVLDAVSTWPDHLLPLLIQVSNLLQSLDSGSVTFISDSGNITPFIADDHR